MNTTTKFKQVLSSLLGLVAITLIPLNYINIAMPFAASYGGQWNIGSSHSAIGSRDVAFYPQPLLHPYDLVVYGLGLVVCCVLVGFGISQKRGPLAFWGYAVAGFLPVLWAVAVLTTGFNYQACGLASIYNICSNPTTTLLTRVAISLGTMLATIGFLKYFFRQPVLRAK